MLISMVSRLADLYIFLDAPILLFLWGMNHKDFRTNNKNIRCQKHFSILIRELHIRGDSAARNIRTFGIFLISGRKVGELLHINLPYDC